MCVAVCCSVLQYVLQCAHRMSAQCANLVCCSLYAVCCRVLQCVAVCCSVLQYVLQCAHRMSAQCANLVFRNSIPVSPRVTSRIFIHMYECVTSHVCDPYVYRRYVTQITSCKLDLFWASGKQRVTSHRFCMKWVTSYRSRISPQAKAISGIDIVGVLPQLPPQMVATRRIGQGFEAQSRQLGGRQQGTKRFTCLWIAQKSPIYTQKSHIYTQKSAIYAQKRQSPLGWTTTRYDTFNVFVCRKCFVCIRSRRRSDLKYLDVQIYPICGQIFWVTGTPFTHVKTCLKSWGLS